MKLLPKQYAKILYDLTINKTGKDLDTAIKEFALFLRKEQMASKLSYIVDEFISYSKKMSGVKQITIKSARKLTEAQIKKISKQFANKVEADVIVEPRLVGGIIVKDGNRVLNGSVKKQIENLKTRL